MNKVSMTCDVAHKMLTSQPPVSHGIIPFKHPENLIHEGMGMSSRRQGVTRVKPRSFACTKVKHYTRSSAQQHIEELKNRNVPGTARLRIIPCQKCSKKEKRPVLHVGHNNGKKGPQK